MAISPFIIWPNGNPSLQEIRADIQELLSHSVSGNLQIFSINSEGFRSEENVLRGREIKRLREEIGWEFAEYGIKMSGIITRKTL